MAKAAKKASRRQGIKAGAVTLPHSLSAFAQALPELSNFFLQLFNAGS
jgi:hypothetical protein